MRTSTGSSAFADGDLAAHRWPAECATPPLCASVRNTAKRFLVFAENVGRDLRDRVEELGRVRVVPRADLGREPARRANAVEHVAQEQQVDPLDGPIAAVGAVRRAESQIAEPLAKDLKRTGGIDDPLVPSVRCRSLMMTSMGVLAEALESEAEVSAQPTIRHRKASAFCATLH